MELSTVALLTEAFYRLLGTESGDVALTERGESADEVAYIYLTRGVRNAQRFMLKNGYPGWRKRSSAISWAGTDETDGGRYYTLPSDFLRADGRGGRSALVEPDGTQWGEEIRADQDHFTGNYYYLAGTQLWLTRNAEPPATLYLLYFYLHPAFAADTVLDFPVEARPLIVAEAANDAKEEDWLPERDTERRIERALMHARLQAMDVCRQTRQPRVMRGPKRSGNRW